MVLISHWSVYMFLSNFLKIKQIHKQIILFACDCYSILSQGVQISITSEILYLILGNYKCNPWNCCVHYSTWTLWKSVIYVFVFLLPCLQDAPVDFIVMATFCSWDHFETHEHSSVQFHSDLVNEKTFSPLPYPALRGAAAYTYVGGELSSWLQEALKPCLVFLKSLRMAS